MSENQSKIFESLRDKLDSIEFEYNPEHWGRSSKNNFYS